jgi:hypothetical protein
MIPKLLLVAVLLQGPERVQRFTDYSGVTLTPTPHYVYDLGQLSLIPQARCWYFRNPDTLICAEETMDPEGKITLVQRRFVARKE